MSYRVLLQSCRTVIDSVLLWELRQEVKVKVKFALEQATKSQRWSKV